MTWSDGRICRPCFDQAVRTTGVCDRCGQHRLLPGRDGQKRLCRACAGITTPLDCVRCGHEGPRYRQGLCVRCALRDDLTQVLIPDPTAPREGTQAIVDAFCAAGRSESIMSWKRNPRVQQALSAIGDGTLPITHASIDHADLGREGEHLRAILVHLALLPDRNSDLIRLEQWLERRLATVGDPGIRRPLEQFATWHHLERIRRKDRRNEEVTGSATAVRQEITAVHGFLNWLQDSKGRTIQDCAQADVDQWLSEGTSARWHIRTFIVWTTKNQLSTHLVVGHRSITSSRLLSNDERLRLLRRCLSDEPESQAYRVAAIILLLYAQPVSRLVGFTIDQVVRSPGGDCYLRIGADEAFVPNPFADLLQRHLAQRSNTQTMNTSGNPFLFPSRRAGQHLTAETVMHRLRRMGIDLLGTRNRALRDLVRQVPPPVVAAQLGYNPRTALKHSALAAEPDQRYSALISRNL